MLDDTKLCTCCQVIKPVTDFRFKNKAENIRATWCKPCFSAYEKKKWRNSEDRRTSQYTNQKARREHARKYIWDYLREHPCITCGETDPRVLEFDHIDPKTKSFQLADGPRKGYSVDTIQSEMDKCQVMCANCHRRHTYEQQGWKCY